tara:strand:- start:765 stop:2006 length:1242 start_codon:yes stop_codon:yes gene_type:complete
MLNLRTFSKYFVLIFLSLFIFNITLADDSNATEDDAELNLSNKSNEAICSWFEMVHVPEIYIAEAKKRNLNCDVKNETIPDNAHADGNSWTCNSNYYRNNAKTNCIKVPLNAYSQYSSNYWYCDSGYEKKGNGCSIIVVSEENEIKDTDISPKVEDIKQEAEGQNNNISLLLKILVFLLVFLSFLLVVIFILFDVKHNGGFSFDLTRKKLKQSKPKPTKQNPNPDLKENEPEVQIPSSDINGHISQQSQNINELKKDLANLLKTIDDMNLTFLTLKDNLDQKDEELSRYKDGYDATIFKNFILRFTRVDKVLKENINDQNFSLGALEDVQIQMEDALAECNIEIFSPSVGDDYQTADGIADNPKQIETSKKGDNLKIAEIIQPGYRRKLPGNDKNDFQIITEAKVAIYVYKDN